MHPLTGFVVGERGVRGEGGEGTLDELFKLTDSHNEYYQAGLLWEGKMRVLLKSCPKVHYLSHTYHFQRCHSSLANRTDTTGT